MPKGFRYNSPPGWPNQPVDWEPPSGWRPDPSWPKAPDGWIFWVPEPDLSHKSEAEVSGMDQRTTPSRSAAEIDESSSAQFVGEDHKAVSDSAAHGGISSLSAEAATSQFQDDFSRVSEPESIDSHSDQDLRSLRGDVVDLSDERVLQEVGIYRYHHPLESSAEYKDSLADLQDRIKELIKQGKAILASNLFTFDNSLAKGRKMTSDLSKLMLRAYNAEADNCVRSLRAGNVLTAKRRLEASVTAIARLGSIMEMRVSPEYHSLRIEELEMTSDFLMKLQEEKERAREERERLREERKVALELAAEREKLDKERAHHINAIEALKASGDTTGLQELLDKLKTIDDAIERNDYRAANIRCGYIYVISNEGAFGKGVVKIGLTRRLEPEDRIRELSGASVPFPFDIHALFFSEDAVSLETQLHQAFSGQRVNCVNERKEFFFATPHEVRELLAEKLGNLLEFTEEPEATQYLQSRGAWIKSLRVV